MDARLLGIWKTDVADVAGVQRYGVVRLHFLPTGELIYTIRSEDADEVIRLTYRVDGNTITTSQPSQPREEKTQFHITDDGKLKLNFGGVSSSYCKLADKDDIRLR